MNQDNYGHPYTRDRRPKNITINGVQTGVKDTSYEDAKKTILSAMRKSWEHAKFLQSFGKQHAPINKQQVEDYHERQSLEHE